MAPPPPSPLRTRYLVLYNLASAAAWAVVLGRTAGACAREGPGAVYGAVGAWTKWVQTAAVAEVLHALFGLVRAPVATTLMQVSSRLLLVWAVVDASPRLATAEPWYASMLAAWAAAEVVRYGYFARALVRPPPAALVWLRYSAFYLLYPLGIGSECALVWAATRPEDGRGPLERRLLYAVLLIYVPGSYVLFTHMMSQRRKVLRSLGAKDR
ncbi:hypothetical protein CDD83_2334 [Cordyceps sp. RAO-2017]|nr:hypothetical protein CDD83_2334 [Cordyceps sp. RAO-2017]